MAAIGRLEEAQVDVDAAAVSDVLGIPINAVQRGLDELAAGSERRGGRSSS
jgi:hypothetical protein